MKPLSAAMIDALLGCPASDEDAVHSWAIKLGTLAALETRGLITTEAEDSGWRFRAKRTPLGDDIATEIVMKRERAGVA